MLHCALIIKSLISFCHIFDSGNFVLINTHRALYLMPNSFPLHTTPKVNKVDNIYDNENKKLAFSRGGILAAVT